MYYTIRYFSCEAGPNMDIILLCSISMFDELKGNLSTQLFRMGIGKCHLIIIIYDQVIDIW